MSYSGCITQKQHDKDEAISRQVLYSFQHLVERKIVKVGELNPIAQRVGRLTKHLLPLLLQRRRTYDDENVFRPWRNLEHVLEEPRNFEALADVGRVIAWRAFRQVTASKGGITS